jgi:hypothetical protein
MSNAVVAQGPMGIEELAMPIESVLRQVELIQKVQRQIMKQDEHYGVIPGTKKNTLYKSGAEKLCMVFRLAPTYDFINTVREQSFISYTVKCTLTHISTGQLIGTGIGSCNSREDKYRFTHRDELTDKPVPADYWNAKNSGDNQAAKRMLGGDGFRAAKNDSGKWVIARSEKVENDNAFNLDNTITKMACKRALIAATLNATAASDIFTQDLDDITVKKEEAEQKAQPNLSQLSPEYKDLMQLKDLFPDFYTQMVNVHGGEPANVEQYKIAIKWINEAVSQSDNQ